MHSTKYFLYDRLFTDFLAWLFLVNRVIINISSSRHYIVIEENGDDVLIVPLMLIMIYSFVFMITKRNGFGMLLCFESSTILAMVIGLTAQYSIGHKFSALTLSLILSFVLCSTIMLLLAFLIMVVINFRCKSSSTESSRINCSTIESISL